MSAKGSAIKEVIKVAKEAKAQVVDIRFTDLFGTWQNESTIYYSNSDCSGEGEVMGSDFDDAPDQIEINGNRQ